MRNSFYVFTFVGKKLISRTKPDKERTVAKPLQLKRKKKKYTDAHTNRKLRKKFQEYEGCMYVCIYLHLTYTVLSVCDFDGKQHLGYETLKQIEKT